MSQTYSFPLIHRQWIAQDTLELTFQASESYVFQPGQYAYLSLTLKNGNVDDRLFSFVNAPNATHTLILAARIRTASLYKEALSHLMVGDLANFSLPLGYFSYPSDTTIPIVCVASGIGIVPFLSLLEQDIHLKNTQRNIRFFLTNKNHNTAVYTENLQAFSKLLPNMHVSSILTQLGNTRLTVEDIIKGDTNKSLFYLAGTPEMVMLFEAELRSKGISLSSIFLESFTGYEL